MPHISKYALAWTSLGVSLVALVLKYAAWRVTGSIALYSDAMETIINVVAALAGLWALRVASLPPDENHTYGHYKAEYLSAVVEGVLVILTALAIGREAWLDWHDPTLPRAPLPGILLNGSAGLLNLAWAQMLLRAGRAHRSPTLIAAGQHVMSDVWTTVGLICGFTLIPLTGWVRLDATLAGLIALNVLRVGWDMMRTSIAGLMDEAPDPDTLADIRTIIADNARGALEAHDLRARIVGAMAFVEFHLVVPGGMSVDAAHEICDRIEAALRARIGQALIHIHVEPERKAKHEGIAIPA
ncbi:cation efflux system protein [Gluconacetobacter johannae DSM 13595]|uniref:Cation transporter n=1 Tax=Gluconacetobacter johannae TaxID=112140 RepID=A0A7W4J9G5_9PROT|nr:cation diffusion facilitator family transporter [Gluconacetobacter johannae]MBB2177129.1 cation transporter [Gluconacetobacter johannae]GBQ90933.1 cation efflux system protein [Gluconacetobacter johannae DSM 13595]